MAMIASQVRLWFMLCMTRSAESKRINFECSELRTSRFSLNRLRSWQNQAWLLLTDRLWRLSRLLNFRIPASSRSLESDTDAEVEAKDTPQTKRNHSLEYVCVFCSCQVSTYFLSLTVSVVLTRWLAAYSPERSLCTQRNDAPAHPTHFGPWWRIHPSVNRIVYKQPKIWKAAH